MEQAYLYYSAIQIMIEYRCHNELKKLKIN